MAQVTEARGSRAPARRRGWLGDWNSAVTSYYLLVGATTILVILGLVMVLSASSVDSIHDSGNAYKKFLPQLVYAIAGLVVVIVASRLPVSFYRRAAWPVFVGSLLLACLVFLPGFGLDAEGGNRAWIKLGPVRGQPSEFVKLGLALWLGLVLGRKQRLLGQLRHVLVPGVIGVGLAVGLVLAGKDLGTALVLLLIVAGAYWVAGTDWRIFAVAGAGAVAVVAVAVLGQASGDRVGRIRDTYGPCVDTLNDCYQSLHGMYGLATGGWTGVGLGASREKWRYLPAADNDYIFSVTGEELGLLGTLVVLGLYTVLGVAMLRIVRNHLDPFVQIATAGIACWIVGQAFINIGVVIGLLPVIGVPLPLMSSGGSALVAAMAALGVVISFARSEPGAAEALAARPSVARRSFSVMSGAVRRVPLRRSRRSRA
ncbi:cell division-specific peptidoglycan biosynthesis regulator FtsW [Sediminihabitans luteus]|uniref:Probable peptidoglycan glycosyltransferase FtsW n=1 Tax=Sediminihabitans luteus TaxID=1138585 RepID=A0A2M9CCH7_9CELL|nr:putative lipid II flippase FtsW [Sediminihabitans luteus]PJJ69082.1 cell division-specific peptidoglycan biosynthesis regulator FtsW [Sediminihabitans luteus]GII99468.1 cell division protein FtsW [Sediminihabitans luteus]